MLLLPFDSIGCYETTTILKKCLQHSIGSGEFSLRLQLPYHRLRQTQKSKVLPIDWSTDWERFDAGELFAFDLGSIPDTMLQNMRKRQEVLMDGNQAAISVLTRLVDGLCGYPITPSTPIAETFARVAANGQKNLFGNELMYFQPSDELSAIAAVEAMACQGGRYADNTCISTTIVLLKLVVKTCM